MTPKLKETFDKIDHAVAAIYECLPKRTMLCVVGGHGNISRVKSYVLGVLGQVSIFSRPPLVGITIESSNIIEMPLQCGHLRMIQHWSTQWVSRGNQ